MAEINIERKKGKKPVWPWILGLLLLAGIIWAISDSDDEPQLDEVAAVEEPYAEESVAAEPQSNVLENEPTEIADFVSYVNTTEVKERMGLDHVVTSEALMRLSQALKELGEEDYSQQINDIQQTAQQIQTDPESLKHADRVNNAFSKAADVLMQIKENRFPETAESEVQELQEIAREIEDGQPLLEQKEEVKSFFENAAQVVDAFEDEQTI